ncbi:MAG: hypothetical protein ACYSW1_13900 [Planctomycetota bacterium]|jgi:hypothetical protein
MRTLSHVALVRVVALIAPLAAAAGGQTPTGDPDAGPSTPASIRRRSRRTTRRR